MPPVLKALLIRAVWPALGAAVFLLLVRAATASAWETAPPVLRLSYLVLVVVLIAASLVGGAPLRSRNLAIWGAVFTLIGATPFLASDWMSSGYRFLEGDVRWANQGQARDRSVACAADLPSQVTLERRRDGHYYVEARASHTAVYSQQNGPEPWEAAERCTAINFLVDTGATGVSLIEDDARRLGVDLDSLDYFIGIQTATSREMAAPILIRELVIGGNRFENVRALVHPGRQSLLGMDVLEQFASVQIARDRLVLTP
jgi:clan AA aspartic protease (TIGR02281 family)